MDRLSILALALASILILPITSAHQPRISMGLDIHSENTSLLIPEPEISKAYYGELNGSPDYYKLILANTTDVYFGVLVPDVPGDSRLMISAEVYDYKDSMSRTQALLLDGPNSRWDLMYEDFGGDWYIAGPAEKANLTPQTYYIQVFNSQNQGKYALAVGDIESFPPQEIANAYILLPVLKQTFFGRPVLFSFFSFLGIILAMGSFFAGIMLALTASMQRIKTASKAYGKLRNLAWAGFLVTLTSLVLAFLQNPVSLLGMLRMTIFLILILLFLHANSRVARLENNVPGSLKLSMLLSIALWLWFLLLTVAVM
jgi:hypothetical protein